MRTIGDLIPAEGNEELNKFKPIKNKRKRTPKKKNKKYGNRNKKNKENEITLTGSEQYEGNRFQRRQKDKQEVERMERERKRREKERKKRKVEQEKFKRNEQKPGKISCTYNEDKKGYSDSHRYMKDLYG